MRQIIHILSLLVASALAAGQEVPPTAGAVSKRMMSFYLHPSQAEFAAIQEGIEKNRADFAGHELVVATFLARVHAKHGWPLVELGDLSRDARAIAARDSSDLSRYVHDDSQVDPAKLDVWWTSFFATGDTDYLERIIEQVGDLDAASGAGDLLVMGAANWSFTSNCRKHPTVLQYAQSVLEREVPVPNREKIREIVSEVESDG